jgi:Ner family transcriptional regulator
MESMDINLTTYSISPLDINYSLRKVGFNQAEIARALEVSPSTVSSVINGKASSYHVARFIADKLNTTVESLWPDRYVFKPRGGLKM